MCSVSCDINCIENVLEVASDFINKNLVSSQLPVKCEMGLTCIFIPVQEKNLTCLCFGISSSITNQISQLIWLCIKPSTLNRRVKCLKPRCPSEHTTIDRWSVIWYWSAVYLDLTSNITLVIAYSTSINSYRFADQHWVWILDTCWFCWQSHLVHHSKNCIYCKCTVEHSHYQLMCFDRLCVFPR